jgi:hypothetical protein
LAQETGSNGSNHHPHDHDRLRAGCGKPIDIICPPADQCVQTIDGSRQPSENELAVARFQGRLVAQIINLLAAGRKALG